MTPRSWWILAAVLILLAYLIAALFLWNAMSRPAERFSEWSPAEKRAIKIMQKEHGHFTLIRTAAGMYFERGGGIVWISRREK